MNTNHEFIRYSIFNRFKNVVAFSSTKQTFNVLNPRYTGDSVNNYIQNRALLAKKLGIQPKQLIFPRQTHSDNVVEINKLQQIEINDTDALITDQQNICICVQTADCVPVLLYEPKLKVIAIVHAGWRGTVKKIVEKTIKKMIQDYQVSSNHIVAAIGPSVGPKIYEVGDEVVTKVKETFTNHECLLIKKLSGKYHFNLWEANRQILLSNNVHEENIEILEECTFELNHKYFSARKEGVITGRIVSGIMMKS